MNEERLVAWLARHNAGIGDDTAALPRLRGNAIVTVDQQIEGIHFPTGLDPRIVARRLLAVNLSDLAASGAIPRHAFLALAAPARFDHLAFFTSLFSAAKRHDVELAGGDLSRAQSLHLSLTLIGEKLPGDALLGRDRARSGHVIWLGGSLGESALGQRLVARGARPRGSTVSLPALFSNKGKMRAAAVRAVRRHFEPEPQLELGRWLSGLGPRRAGAAIDVSDGFAKDLHRVCDASGTGAKIDVEALDAATPPLFTELCAALGENGPDLRDGGGEDYILLFTLPKRIAPPPELDCLPIGVITRERAVRVVDAKGRSGPLRVRGWDHLSKRAATIQP